MPVCPDGSAPKPTAPPFFVYDDAYIALRFGSIAGWLVGLVMGLPSTPQVTADFCASDPPTDLPTTSDYALLAFPALALASGAYTRFANQIRAQKWADLCDCQTATPGLCHSLFDGFPPTFVQATFSGSSVTVGNTFVANTTGLTCTGGRWYVPTGTNPGTTIKLWRTLTATLLDTITISPLPNSGFYDFEFATPVPLTNGETYTISHRLDNLSEYLYQTPRAIPFSNAFISGGDGVSVAGTTAMPTGNPASYYGLEPQVCQGDAGTPYIAPDLEPPPVGYPDPPAPPDCTTTQAICDAIARIFIRLDSISRLLELVQRQEVPFGYVNGASWTGLTGDGELTIQGVIGVRVDFTTIPDYVGRFDGTPTTYFNVGQVALGTADGYQRRELLRHDPQFVFSGEAGLFTRVGYTFAPGVVATLTELLREP